MGKSRIMYLEEKPGVASLTARIGRVEFSKTGKTLKYQGREFQSLKGYGYKSNYFDVESGDRYWISGCRKDGNDGLYRTTVLIDEDCREEYWTDIRGMPDRVSQSQFVSSGKHRPGGQEPKGRSKNI